MFVTEPNPTPAVDGNSVLLSLINNNATKGDFLADPNGMTLYSFDNDTNGVSNCYDICAQNWPAYMLTNIPSTLPTNWSVTTRTDGTKQYTYKGMPLYFYSKDTKPEDVTGDGVGGVWHLVKP